MPAGCVDAGWETARALIIRFLNEHIDIQHIAFNFQTGYSKPAEGKKALENLIQLQQNLGRDLSLVMIGGSQFVSDATMHFARLTVIDSTPFMKSYMRRRLVLNGPGKRHWVKHPTKPGTPIDDLLQTNVESYANHIARMAGHLFG